MCRLCGAEMIINPNAKPADREFAPRHACTHWVCLSCVGNDERWAGVAGSGASCDVCGEKTRYNEEVHVGMYMFDSVYVKSVERSSERIMIFAFRSRH